MNYPQLARTQPSSLVTNSLPLPRPTSIRRRRKRHLAWEQAELASGGVYSRNLDAIARCYPMLTPMELRVCALVKAMLPSWKIAELLAISEKAVENYRVKIRRKTGCCGERLTTLLAKIEFPNQRN